MVIVLCVHCGKVESGGTEQGGATGEAGEAGQGGSNEAGQGGSNEAGQGGSNEAGQGGSNEAGQGGSNEAGQGGSGATSGTAGGSGGSGGAAPPPSCPGDGCVLLRIPGDTAIPAPPVDYTQFVTINLDLDAGVDLSDSVITAHVRAIGFKGTTETIQLYASAQPNFNYWGNAANLSVSAIADGGTLSMDLTDTGTTWDAKHVVAIGLLVRGGSSLTTIQILVEDIIATVKADPTATPKYGPWLFTQQTDVNETPAEQISGSFAEPNVIFPHPYQAVTGTQTLWLAPSP